MNSNAGEHRLCQEHTCHVCSLDGGRTYAGGLVAPKATEKKGSPIVIKQHDEGQADGEDNSGVEIAQLSNSHENNVIGS